MDFYGNWCLSSSPVLARPLLCCTNTTKRELLQQRERFQLCQIMVKDISEVIKSLSFFLSFCTFQSMTMMFEVQDLAVASPATVSRCGMVYLEPSILGLEPFIECWLQKLPGIMQPFSQQLASLFRRFLKVSYYAVSALPWLGACQLRYRPAQPCQGLDLNAIVGTLQTTKLYTNCSVNFLGLIEVIHSSLQRFLSLIGHYSLFYFLLKLSSG